MEDNGKVDIPPKMQKLPSLAGTAEEDEISKFLLDQNRLKLFCEQHKYVVSKIDLRKQFERYLDQPKNKGLSEKFTALCGKSDIDTILSHTDYIIVSLSDSNHYRINNDKLYQYRKKLLDEKDNLNYMIAANKENKNSIENQNDLLNVEEHCHLLIYEGTMKEKVRPDFIPTNWSCYICQENFSEKVIYEQHVRAHSDEDGFNLARKLAKCAKPLLMLYYQLCKNSYYFSFTIQMKLQNIVIDKIIIIMSRSFFYVQNARMPCEVDASGRHKFFVDSHLFARYLEQPIVVVFHSKDQPKTRFVEQHHFIRTQKFSKLRVRVNGNHLPKTPAFAAKVNVPEYLPPSGLRQALIKSKTRNSLKNLNKEFAEYCGDLKLTQQNIHTVLKLLVQVEDLELLEQYRKYTQLNVSFTRQFLKIYVTMTLANGTLEAFDRVEFKSCTLSKTYTGVIVRVSSSYITIMCSEKVKMSDKYNVYFNPMRMPIRYQHHALKMLEMKSKNAERFFFPWNLDPPRPIYLENFVLFNKSIRSNPEQMEAIMNIVNGPNPKAPYIIYGPPGTGKTTTIVEAIMQLYVRRPKAHILVTAGSNGGCDELATRLYNLLEPRKETRAMVRIYSQSMELKVGNIDMKLLERSNLYDQHFYPNIDVLHKYRIIICTMTVVGKLCTGESDREGTGLYTHVFLDECAASTATEALVSIMGTLSPNGNLIISGDHKQLGPFIRSDLANSLGFGISLLERLMENNCYRVCYDGTYNHNYQTRLCLNFRSHPEIMRLYNELYYDSKLTSLAGNDVYYFGRHWYRCPNPKFPILFHSVFGTTTYQDNSTSPCNMEELEVVLDYVRDLMYFGVKDRKVTQHEIGIISPYKRQYQLIQEQLNLRKWHDIKTGSVESFQGKEKEIIIVSFVRSFTNSIGFLKNPRRLNVALSRAKSLLILIGNPETLSKGNDFNHIINECKVHNTFIDTTTNSCIPKTCNTVNMQILDAIIIHEKQVGSYKSAVRRPSQKARKRERKVYTH